VRVSPFAVPCAPGKYREISDFAALRDRTHAVK
jgi:hypothetical protein